MLNDDFDHQDRSQTNTLEQKIQTAHYRLEVLRRQAGSLVAPSEELLDTAIEELAIALEELHVTTEELHQQNDELLTTQQALAAERQRYKGLFELAPNGYLVTNLRGVIWESNQTAATLLNVSQRFLVGKPIAVYIARADRERLFARLGQFVDSKQQQLEDWEVRLHPREQNPFPAAITVSSILNSEDQKVVLRWVFSDIRERKHAELLVQNQLAAERKLNEIRSRLIGAVSHEFRTPLGVIQASVQMLERYSHRLSEEDKQQCLERAQNGITYLSQLLDQILLVNQAQTDQLALNPTPLDLELFCRRLQDEFQTQSGDQRVIKFTSRGQCRSACLDVGLLRQILSNLLSNALRYSPQETPVDFELTCQSDEAIFRIRDQGMGIAPEDQPHLFKPFYRAKNAEALPGVGLGLTIVEHCVALQGGTIAVESQVGFGTTVAVTLPLTSAPDSMTRR